MGRTGRLSEPRDTTMQGFTLDCPACYGTGADAMESAPCEACAGTGRVCDEGLPVDETEAAFELAEVA